MTLSALVVVGLLALLQDATGWDVGPLTGADRISLLGGLGLILTSAALLVAAGRLVRPDRRPMVLGILGSALGSLALTALLGAVYGLTAWGQPAPMNGQAAIAFMLTAVGLGFFAWVEHQRPDQSAARWLHDRAGDLRGP